MKKNLIIILAIVFFPIFVWGQPPEVKPEQIITLVFSSNVYGEFEPCG
jgi:hypothetical protein